jgi:hypothetical protein
VFISYGPQGNDSLLQFYGFVEAGNPHDAHTVPGLRQAAAAAGCGLPAASLQALPADAKARGSSPLFFRILGTGCLIYRKVALKRGSAHQLHSGLNT